MPLKGKGGPAAPAVKPPFHSVFAPVYDRFGRRLALVFGNHARGGVCPYFRAGRCSHCDIGAGEGARFDTPANLRRLVWFQQHYSELWPHVAHVVLYNSGSVLSPFELAPVMLGWILDFTASLPAIRAVSLDSREPYVRAATLRRALEHLRPDQQARPILGVESADDRIRDGLLRKSMSRRAMERAARELAAVAADVGPSRIGLDVNVVIAGPGTLPSTAIEDALATARYALSLGERAAVEVDLNLHPYYPSERGLARFPDHPRCEPELAMDAVRAIAQLRQERGRPAGGLFIGWQDEGHDQQRSLRREQLARAITTFDRFNRTQELAALGASSSR